MSSKEEVENEVAEFVSPLKVDKLKAELKRRGIDTQGKKADLVKRLQDAMVDERVQGENIPIDPENGNQDEMDDVPDDSVHSTTEHQNQEEPKPTSQVVDLEPPGMKEVSEQSNPSDNPPAPQTVEIECPPNVQDCDNSEVPPDSTDKMEEDEPKSKPVDEPEEELPPLDAETVDEDDAGETLELDTDSYIPPEDENLFVLDPVNSEVNFQIQEGGLTAQNRQDGPLQLLWAGGRANFGVKEGMFGFECRLVKSLETTVVCEEVPAPGVRVGWSTDESPFLLGTGPDSYAYDSSGYIVRDRNLTSYGDNFSEGDVVTALINFESNPPETSFSKNGTDLGTAHQINKGMIDALFPHISSRQFQLVVNFGATPFEHELPEGFLPLSSVEEEKRIKPGQRTGEEKELLCLIGLPGCGKTRWAEKYIANNECRRYTHLCTELIQSLFYPDFSSTHAYEGESSTVRIVPYKSNIYDGLCKLAATKDRHLIIDTQSIFKSTQERRMKAFDGFKRIAVIVHPYDNFLAFRQRQVAETIPRAAVLKQMKAAFHIPDSENGDGGVFSEVRFPELAKDRVIKSLSGEPQWAPRKDNRRRDRFQMRGGRGGRRDYRDPRDRDRDRKGYRPGPLHHSPYRGGYGNYYGGSPGYSRGSYQPYYNPYGGGYGHSSYYGQGGYGGGSYGDYRGGYYDRRHSGPNRGNKRVRK